MPSGGIMMGDADGVVVIPQEQAAEILAKAQAVMAKEQQVRERIKQGEYIFDMLKLGDALKGLGVVEK